MDKIYNIPDFLAYLNLEKPQNKHIHFTKYEADNRILPQSEPIKIDFYLLAIKNGYDKKKDFGQTQYDMADSFIYFDQPQNFLSWNIENPFTGYHILLDATLFKRFAKDYSFLHYKNHEGLFLTKDEETQLMDLFKKSYELYNQATFSQEILVSYASLILSYINSFYKRQFETRENIYNKVVADFYENLDNYYDLQKEPQLASVHYFAEKANLSTNYFGDLIKQFTGTSPQEHINQHVLQLAKNKLRQTDLSISEIGYSLGFESNSYFTRFFKKEAGITPSIFRNQ